MSTFPGFRIANVLPGLKKILPDSRNVLPGLKYPLLLSTLFAVIPSALADRPLPLHIFLGSDLGYSSVTPFMFPEGGRNGPDLDLKLMGSAYFKQHWILDAGGGWGYSKRSGEHLNGG